MSYVKILVHCVWATKNRIPVLKDEIREKVIYHIKENALKKGIFIDHINGYHQHLHALISLGGKQDISDIMQLIKGESSFWINKNKLTQTKFEWQDDFYSVSIGISQLYSIRQYIRNQPGHHAFESFEEELEKFIAEYQLEKKLD
jgi:REP element-mobilizing transposase RayT